MTPRVQFWNRLAERARRRIVRVDIGLGWGRGVDTRQGIRRPQGPSAGTQTINQKKEAIRL
jgi:hypothetical protein